MKAVGPIWLGLTNRVVSIRRYDDFDEVRKMISRSAYAQLKYSPLLLAGVTLGMALTFLAGPVLALFGDGTARILGLLTWALMAVSFQPMLRFYRACPALGAGRSLRLRWPTCYTPWIPPTATCGGRAAAGRDGFKRTCRDHEFGRCAASIGQGLGDENFPVASWVVAAPHRRPILSFYEFVRIADDIADHATMKPADKLRASRPPRRQPARPQHRQRRRRDAARGACRAQPDAAARPGPAFARSARTSPAPLQGLGRSHRVVAAIRRCRSAATCSTCTAEPRHLGRIGQGHRGAADHRHLQDCVKDYRTLDRVYVPLDALQ